MSSERFIGVVIALVAGLLVVVSQAFSGRLPELGRLRDRRGSDSNRGPGPNGPELSAGAVGARPPRRHPQRAEDAIRPGRIRFRPHRALARRTPAHAFTASTKAKPRRPGLPIPAHHRVRRDRIDKTGKVILRYRSKLLHLGVGRRHVGTRVIPLVTDGDVPVMNDDGELLAQFTIDPTKIYQPKNDPDNIPNLSGMPRDTRPGCLTTQQVSGCGDSNPQPSDL
jgi:hypothetical protein